MSLVVLSLLFVLFDVFRLLISDRFGDSVGGFVYVIGVCLHAIIGTVTGGGLSIVPLCTVTIGGGAVT